MTQNTGKILIIIMTILLLVNGYILMGDISRDKQDYLSRIENKVYNQNQTLQNLKQDIDKLNEKSGLISTYNYDIKNIENDYKNANVGVEIEFNKLKKDSVPYLIYSIEGKDNEEKIKLDKELGLRYTTDLNL